MTTRAAVEAGWRGLGLALAALIALPCAGASGSPVRIQVPGPYQIGARSFPAGTVQVHRLRDFTPTTALLVVWADGECLGMVRARIATTEEPPGTSEATFLRRADGRLALIGFSVASGADGRSYRFETPFDPAPELPPVPQDVPPATTAAAVSLGTR